MATASHIIIRKRITILLFCAVILMVGLVGRLAYLQFFRSQWLLENALEQRIRDIPVEAKRGVIYDRNGKKMAVSNSIDSVYAIPAEVKNIDETAAALHSIFGGEVHRWAAKLKQRQAFTWIKRKVTAEQSIAVKRMNLPGLGITQESKRFYPNENLAAHILGFTGIDNQGLDGVELTFDQYLSGKAGKITVEYDGGGREIPETNHKFHPAEEGHDVYLTIDYVIQSIVERELERAVQETQAKAGTIIALNPKTGEVLAMANKPDYNPNRFGEFNPKLWRNTAVSNVYEPGSTFKIITASSGLQEKMVRVDERFYDPGFIEVQDRRIRCWRAGGHGSQTFAEVVKNSCNPGFITVGLRLGKETFYNYIENFGFAQLTNIELPGEAKGILIKRNQAKPINIATMSIGQSIAVSPIQLVTAAAAVANDGVLLKPQIVKEVKAKDGTVVRRLEPEVIRQVITKETAYVLKELLRKVVEEGSGRNAYIAGFNIAGKTGTAQKVGGHGYEPGKYVASFVGFAPAEDPQIAMIVIIDEPVGLYYGGQIAAPIFGAVMKDVLMYLKLQPHIDNKATAQNDQPVYVTVPNIINMTAGEAQEAGKVVGLTIRLEQNGERVVYQVPSAGTMVPKGTGIIAYFQRENSEAEATVTVPDLTEYTLRKTAELLGQIGLAFNPIGNGIAVRQEPYPGMKVKPGTTITVFFEPMPH